MSQQTLDRIDEKIRECGHRDAANALESVLKRINSLLEGHYRPPISDDDPRDDEVKVKFPIELGDPVRIHNPDGCLFLVERIEDGTFYIIDVETTGGWDAPPDVDGFFYKPLELTRMRTFWAHGKGYREIYDGTTQTLMCPCLAQGGVSPGKGGSQGEAGGALQAAGMAREGGVLRPAGEKVYGIFVDAA